MRIHRRLFTALARPSTAVVRPCAVAFALAALAAPACTPDDGPAAPPSADAPATPGRPASAAATPPSGGPASASASALGPAVPGAAPQVVADPAHPVRVFIDGADRTGTVPPETLAGQGFTLLNLRNDWTPYIFAEFEDDEGQHLPNRYRPIYIGLANDRTDGDGRELPTGAENFLELFGLPPSLGVVRARLLRDEEKACHREIDYALLGSVERIPLRKPKDQKAADAAIARMRKQLDEARVQGGFPTVEALVAARADLADEAAAVDVAHRQARALPEVIKRLKCDGHLKANARFKVDPDDGVFREALQSFQMRHMIYEYPGMRPGTMKMLARRPLESNYDQFVRALRERVTEAARILEDGTATVDGQPATWRNAAGETVPVRNLVQEFTDAALVQLGLQTPEALLAFLKAQPADVFDWLQAAVRLPQRPEYHRDHMEMDVVVDRGDVWYQPTWGDDGVLRYPARERMPRFTLYVTHEGQRFPIIHWPTTIGGWRAEQAANGYEYYRYKGSDVGKRVIRKILSGPTWVAPPSTPIRGLVKAADVNGKRQRIVNYDEMGPGYLSAYGLVAGYFVVPGQDGRPDWDNGIRAHGSSDYLSITNPAKFSHGCHRLMNHLAVRLYDFLLNHRNKKVMGDQRLNASRQFYKDGNVYEVRLASRGFEFQLTPPLPVDVLEGRIRGSVSRPIEGYMPKPDVVYPPGPVPSPKGGAEP